MVSESVLTQPVNALAAESEAFYINMDKLVDDLKKYLAGGVQKASHDEDESIDYLLKRSDGSAGVSSIETSEGI